MEARGDGGSLACLRHLLEAGADVDLQVGKEGITPLMHGLHHLATKQSNVEEEEIKVKLDLIQALIDHDCSLLLKNTQGQTALEVYRNASSAEPAQEDEKRLLAELTMRAKLDADVHNVAQNGESSRDKWARREQRGTRDMYVKGAR